MLTYEESIGQAVDFALETAGAYEQGHFVFNSGVHSDDKVVADRLVSYPEGLEVVRWHLKKVLAGESWPDGRLYVPVPTGMSTILEGWEQEADTIYPTKVGRREFSFNDYDVEMIHRVGRAAILDDVLTTGGSAAAMAEQIRRINPRISLSLFGIVLGGEVLPQHARHFRNQKFLLKRPMPTWPADECPNPGCQVGTQ